MENIILNSLDYPILTITTFLPLAGVLIILLLKKEGLIRIVALVTTITTQIVSLPIYQHFNKTTYKMQFVENRQWIPTWNINYIVGVDGISVLFILLTTILSILCVLVSWKAISDKVKEFHIALLVMETTMIGVFISLD
ncbi:MAG: NADH-quinone oxidoreductase subunit M, partial [Nitrospinota bacterium]